MTIHQCPKCDLRFEWNTELDDHCWHDHPEFRHEYPAQPVPEPPVEQHREASTPAERYHMSAGSLFGWLQPDHERERPPHRNPG